MAKRKVFTKEERKKVYQKCNGHCAYCGCELKFEDMQIDHVVSLEHHNGTNDMENLLPSCRSCNHYKSTFPLERFRAALERIPSVLERDCVTYQIAKRYGLVVTNKEKVVFYFEQQNKDDE